MIAFGLQSMAFGVGAPKRSVLFLSCLHVLFPRHVARELKFKLSRICRLSVASRTPLSVSAGHLVALSVEAQQSPTGAHAECTGSAEIVQRSTAL